MPFAHQPITRDANEVILCTQTFYSQPLSFLPILAASFFAPPLSAVSRPTFWQQALRGLADCLLYFVTYTRIAQELNGFASVFRTQKPVLPAPSPSSPKPTATHTFGLCIIYLTHPFSAVRRASSRFCSGRV